MNKKITYVLISMALFALCAFNTAHAEPYPGHYLNPGVCTPPTPPSPGQPGYGESNAFYNGIYWDPGSGLWFIPDGLYDGNDSDRDVEIIEDAIAGSIPSRPAWAIFDMESDGTYYFSGGYYNGHYYPEGYYFPNDIS